MSEQSERRIITAEEARALREAATPGPWRVTDADSVAPRVGGVGGAWPVAFVPGDDDDRPWDVDGDVPSEPTPLADADLIAAAPDLARTVEQLTADRDALQRRLTESEEAKDLLASANRTLAEQVVTLKLDLALVHEAFNGGEPLDVPLAEALSAWVAAHG